MKRLYLFAVCAVLMAAQTCFTSCEPDDYWDEWYDDWTWGRDYDHRPDVGNVDNEDFFVAMARTLNGKWQGQLRAYTLDEQGQPTDSMDYDCDMEFVQHNDQSIGGTGTHWFFNPQTGEEEMKYTFAWTIDTRTGNVNVVYNNNTDGGTTTFTIPYNDLNLSDRTFTGWMDAQDKTESDDFWFDRYDDGTRAGMAKGGKAKVVRMKWASLAHTAR